MRVRVIRVLPQVSFPRPETVAVRAAGPTVRPDRRTWRGRGTVRGAGATGGAGGRILAGSWRDPSEKLAGTFRDGSGTVRGRFEDDSRTIRGYRGGGNAVRPGRRPRRWGRAPALRHRPHRPCHWEGGVAGRTVWPGATPCKRPVGNALRGRAVGAGGQHDGKGPAHPSDQIGPRAQRSGQERREEPGGGRGGHPPTAPGRKSGARRRGRGSGFWANYLIGGIVGLSWVSRAAKACWASV
jgi:hypothetical protein